MKTAEIRYAKSGDIRVAYQVIGNGPLDLIFVPGFMSNLEVQREDAGYSHLLRRHGIKRLHRPARAADFETRMDNMRAVIDAIAAIARHWSTMLDGMQTDFAGFKRETDTALRAAGEKAKPAIKP
jgi:hypothetical protein